MASLRMWYISDFVLASVVMAMAKRVTHQFSIRFYKSSY